MAPICSPPPETSSKPPYNFPIPGSLQAIFDACRPSVSAKDSRRVAISDVSNIPAAFVNSPGSLVVARVQPAVPLSGVASTAQHKVATMHPTSCAMSSPFGPGFMASANAVASTDVACTKILPSWKSLFTNKPRNAGKYISK